MILIQLTGGAFQDPLQNVVANGTLVVELVASESALGYIYANLSPASEVGMGFTVRIPLDANGNVIESPEYQVYANDQLTPPNTYYRMTVYTAEGQLVWGPNSQVILSSLSPLSTTVDLGQLVPNQITES